ncbi:thioredoxin family protein, partial [Staphylococcus epidermidis]|uniref:thioredoxin family protein n=1 Tax=Staphylococcus epidermidis TaxID=1282 RepID=UPI00119DF621
SEQQFQQLKKAYTLFQFTPPSSPHSKLIQPHLPKLHKKYTQLQFLSLHTHQFIHISLQNHILPIPTFLIFKQR